MTSTTTPVQTSNDSIPVITPPPALPAAQEISLLLIDEPANADRLNIEPEALDELAKSITSVGVLQPIIVVQYGDRYEIVAGHRRYLATRSTKLSTIPAVVYQPNTTSDIGIIRALENLQRVQLSPIEEAMLIERMHDDQHLDIPTIAKHVHRTQDWVRKRIALATVPQHFLPLIHSGKLAIGHALELLNVTDETHRDHLLEFAKYNGVTLPILRSWVRDWHQSVATGNTAPEIDANLNYDTGAITITCACVICKEDTTYNVSQLIRVCPDCNAAVHK